MSGRQVGLRCKRPVFDGAVDHELARLGAAADRGNCLVGDIDHHVEGPFGENLGPEDALLTDVGAEQEMHQLHKAGLASAVARLAVICALALVGQQDVEARLESEGLE